MLLINFVICNQFQQLLLYFYINSNNVQTEHLQSTQKQIQHMLPKTKTAALILQKQAQKQRQNPQNNSHTHTQNNIQYPLTYKQTQKYKSNHKQLSVHHIAHYNIFNLTYFPQKQQRTQKTLASIGNLASQSCQLERQNYRLIQANFNMLVKFKGLVDKMRDQLFRVVQFIQQYHYGVAIQEIYSLIDMLRKIDDVSTKEMSESIKFFGLDEVKRNLSSKLGLNNENNENNQNQKKNIIKQFQQIPLQNQSHVSQYSMNKSIAHNKINNPQFQQQLQKILQINIGVSQVTYIPPQKQKPVDIINMDDFIVEKIKTPNFSQQDSFTSQNRSFYHNQRMISSLQQLGLNSRVQSAGQFRRKLYVQTNIQQRGQYQIEHSPNQSRYRPYSQKNITIFKSNHMDKKYGSQSKIQQFYRILLNQADSIEHLLK